MAMAINCLFIGSISRLWRGNLKARECCLIFTVWAGRAFNPHQLTTFWWLTGKSGDFFSINVNGGRLTFGYHPHEIRLIRAFLNSVEISPGNGSEPAAADESLDRAIPLCIENQRVVLIISIDP